MDRHSGTSRLVGDAMRDSFAARALDRGAPFYVAGHRGLVGSSVWRHLESEGFTNLLGKSSAELDLRDRDAVFDFFAREKPTNVILAAAKVGGIAANSAFLVDFLSENLRIQVNVLDAALAHGVERLLFLGSSCIYPKLAPQPIKEEYLLTGHLEPTNDAYAIAKIAGILHVQAARRQHGRSWISAMPTNLYGPGDNFSPRGSHVLPALVRRYDEAQSSAVPLVVNWGVAILAVNFCMSTIWRRRVCICSTTTTVHRMSMSEPVRITQFVRSLRWLPTRSDTSARRDGTPRSLTERCRNFWT